MDIEKKVEEIAVEFLRDNPYEIDDERMNKNRGYFKIMCRKLRGAVKIDRDTNKGLYELCKYIDKVLELCDLYAVVPNRSIVSEATGISTMVLNRVESGMDAGTVERLDAEYEQDIDKWFQEVDMGKKVSLKNDLDVYPLHCMLCKVRDMEQDGRVERGKLGDITQLNAAVEVGGFGYAKPSIVVDNRKVMIAGKDETIGLFLSDKDKK